jgi:predicted nucleotidyltransferase
METKVETIVQEARQQLMNLYGSRFRKLILFGSQARGESVAGSDVDLLVILDQVPDFWSEFRKIEEITSRLSLEHDAVISVFPMSERDYQERQTPFLLNVRREGVSVP